MVSPSALFCLATVLATFHKIGLFFSKSSGHPATHQRTFATFKLFVNVRRNVTSTKCHGAKKRDDEASTNLDSIKIGFPKKKNYFAF